MRIRSTILNCVVEQGGIVKSEMRAVFGIIFLFVASLGVHAQARTASASFPPLQEWKAAVLSGNAAMLKGSYSTTPEAKITTPEGPTSIDGDVAFWTGLQARSLKINVAQSAAPADGLQQLVLQMVLYVAGSTEARYVNAAQLWQKQGEQWHLVGMKRTGLTQLQQPVSTGKELYPEGADARAEIREALARAAKSGKRVIVVFGANWCLDCHVLDMAFHRPEFVPLLAKNYEVVHVDIGRGEKNQDLMKEYQVPMNKGIPALAILDSDGKLVTSQKNGEFENARAMAPDQLLEYLNRWKPDHEAQ
jgi:thiol-disulfide isomerase/thioredoxin